VDEAELVVNTPWEQTMESNRRDRKHIKAVAAGVGSSFVLTHSGETESGTGK